MFHVMLVLPLLAAFGAAAFFMVTVPLCLGAGLQLIFSIFSKKRWILLLPAILGAVGVVLSLVYLLEVVGLTALVIYWAVYYLCIWLVWLIVTQIKGDVLRWRTEV